MGEVVKLRKRRKETIRGAARAILTAAQNGVANPSAVIVVCLGADGDFSLRTAYISPMQEFDLYARAGAIIDRRKAGMLA